MCYRTFFVMTKAKSIFSLNDDEILADEVGRQSVLYNNSHDKHENVFCMDEIWNNTSSLVNDNIKII